jgi:ribosomal protein S18 acetylase RimI-like enzyme
MLKRATTADIDALLDLMHEFYAEAGFSLDRPANAAALQCLLSRPALGCIWLAVSNEIPVGHVVLAVRFTMEHTGLSGYIDDLYVRPQFRRMGIGDALLAELVAECRARGCRSLQVEVGEANVGALALYAKFGLHVATDDRVLASGSLLEAGA